MSNEFNELAIIIPKLMGQIPELYFKNNKKKIADFYFEGNEMLAEFAMIFNQKKMEIPCRLDLTQTKNGFKVLELNIGSSIGGWQIHSFENAIRKLHKPLYENKTLNQYKSVNTQTIYMEFLITKIFEYVSLNDNEINIFIALDCNNGKDIIQESLTFFNDLFQPELKKRNLKGTAYSSSLSILKMSNGKLFLRDKVIHSVLLVDKIEEKIPVAVFRALVTNKIYFPDHLGIKMLGDKRNLGLLRELAIDDKFSKEENELILKNIPWSTSIENRDVIFNDKKCSLLKLLREEKNTFVIKPSNGYQGIDVFIGKDLSTNKWLKAIENALSKGSFIAQEFCESINYDVPNESNKWVPNKLIWGVYGFGDTYGGAWVRMSEAKSKMNIINSAKGAVEAMVFEVE